MGNIHWRRAGHIATAGIKSCKQHPEARGSAVVARVQMGWLDLDPTVIQHILITHQDTDHVGAVETDSAGPFRDATLYIGEEENRYLTGEKRRRVIYGLYKLPMVKIENPKVLLKDGQTFHIGDIKIECFLVPGHTWGHMVYLVDETYLFTGDTLWFGVDGGYSFINMLAENNRIAVDSLARLEEKLRVRGLHRGGNRVKCDPVYHMRCWNQKRCCRDSSPISQGCSG